MKVLDNLKGGLRGSFVLVDGVLNGLCSCSVCWMWRVMMMMQVLKVSKGEGRRWMRLIRGIEVEGYSEGCCRVLLVTSTVLHDEVSVYLLYALHEAVMVNATCWRCD